ncbi:MAG TPA: ATP-binding protein [bacterium]|nr:ATP-binding protein [bacterium]
MTTTPAGDAPGQMPGNLTTRCLVFQHAALPPALLPLLRAGGVREIEIITAQQIATITQPQMADFIAVVDENDEQLSVQAERLRQNTQWKLLPWLVFGAETEYTRRVAVLRRGFWEYLQFDDEERTRKKIGLTIDFYRNCRISRHMEGWVSFQFKSEYSFVREVNFFISRLQYMTTLTQAEIEDIQYAFLEIGNNAVEHGNTGNPEKLVDISYLIFEDKLIIRVADEGQGFDVSKIRNPLDDDRIEHARGRGIFLVKQMMDEVDFNDKGNVCLMTKRFAPLPATA